MSNLKGAASQRQRHAEAWCVSGACIGAQNVGLKRLARLQPGAPGASEVAVTGN